MKKVSNIVIQEKKREFRDNYQGKGSAAHLGIIAAVQRAYLYTPNSSNAYKATIRRKWEEILDDLVKKYKTTQQDEKVFKRDIESLKDAMNQAFPPDQNRFNNGKDGYDNEFRIAHAQKSLSICLKHLWCRGELEDNIPPLCPVDGILLKSVHNNDSWTKVNSIEVYEEHIKLFKKAQQKEGYDNLSSWELMTWNSQGGRKKGTISSPKTCDDVSSMPLEPGRKLRGGRDVLWGDEIKYKGRHYFLFAGEKPSFKYLELLTGKSSETLDGCDLIPKLRERGFVHEGNGYIYKKLAPYDEDDARRLLEDIKNSIVVKSK